MNALLSAIFKFCTTKNLFEIFYIKKKIRKHVKPTLSLNAMQGSFDLQYPASSKLTMKQKHQKSFFKKLNDN